MRIVVVCMAVLAFSAQTALGATPKASSELTDDNGVRHSASRAFDGLLQTGWAEGADGLGEGSWLELPLDRSTEITSVSVWPGNLAQGARTLRENARPRTVTVTLLLADGTEVKETVRVQDGAKVGPTRVDVPVTGKTRKVRVSVDDAYEGGVFSDVYIAEVAINFSDGSSPNIVKKLETWHESSSGQRAKERSKEQVIALFEKISETEFGDRDALRKIMDRAGDGPLYLRERVRRLVPAGYRVQALPPDPVAIQALLKLKDANAIPAIEMAALRVKKKEARQYHDRVEYFYAYQELSSGGDRNVPYWGQEGWEPGAFRSFGEPMGIEVDEFGSVWVADTGNHRLQRFSPEGKFEESWGAEAGITNAWYGNTRKYYVAGAVPGEKSGEFVNPVDMVLMPTKEGTGFAVLDAKGRVQLFDDRGRNTIGWALRTDLPITAGVGGEGYLAFSKGRLVAIWGDEVYVYSLTSEEVAQWTIEDGVPNAVETLKNGKLVMVFGRELIQYSADGFRHGKIMDSEDLGTGLEDWDVSLDEKGKLWVVTDTGWAIKYKRPGKIDYKVSIAEFDLIRPRFAVMDDLVFVLERDRILKVDALELKRKAELAEEDDKAAKDEESGL